MNKNNHSQKIGRLGEDVAVRYLESKGYSIWARNFRCKAGEIDIVASKNGAISFIEVKTRRDFNYGRPCESVTVNKKRHIQMSAEYYLKILEDKGYRPTRIHFDVIEVTIRHTENAF